MARRPDSDASIEKIEAAALKLFSAKGYSNTSLEQVANAAGFTKGAVYYYFKTKETLLLFIIDRIQKRSIMHTAEVISAMKGHAVEKLTAVIRLQAQWASNCPDDLTLLILTSLESAGHESKVRAATLHYYAVMENLLTKIITAGKKAGELSPSLDVRSTVLSNIARHDGNMLLWHRSGRDPKVGRLLTAASLNAVAQFASAQANNLAVDTYTEN